MDDAGKHVLDRVQELSDLELATLICLIAEEHCLIATNDDLIDDLEQELRIISSETFGLTSQVIDCSEHTTVDEFGDGILLGRRRRESDFEADRSSGERRPREPGMIASISGPARARGSLSPGESLLGQDEVAQVVIAKNLDRAHPHVQIQALELIRGKRIFSRTGYYTAPKQFLFIGLVSSGRASGLIPHLNDHFFISHYHSPDDGFPAMEDHLGFPAAEEQASVSSVIRSTPRVFEPYGHLYGAPAVITKEDIGYLGQRGAASTMSADVRTYLHNIIVFMRLHRAVAGGVSSLATRHFHSLVRILAPLHGIGFVTPSLVTLAARKIYPHRLMIVRPENERSLQWGSSLEAVQEELEGVTVYDIIDDILEEVEVPV